MTNFFGQEIKGTRFTFEHSIIFNRGYTTLPYRSTRWWKTVNGALRAAESHALGVGRYYEQASINTHALVIKSDLGEFVTNDSLEKRARRTRLDEQTIREERRLTR